MTSEARQAKQRVYWLDAAALVKIVSDPSEEAGAQRVQHLLEHGGQFQTTWVGVAVAYGLLKRRFTTRGASARQRNANLDMYHRRLYQLRRKIADGTITVRTDWLERETLPLFNPIEVKDFARHYEIDFLNALQIFEFRRGIAGSAAGLTVPLLVTSDDRLARAAGALDLAVWNPDRTELPE